VNIDRDLLNRYLAQEVELFGPELFLDLKSPDTNVSNGDYKNLEDFNTEINTCQKCLLGKTRTKFVFGMGDPNADLMLVGEAPGEEEDKTGDPFVGRAGNLLDKILDAIGYSREKGVYICNVIKCRPPENRDPLPDEIEQCEPYLKQQIQLIKPRLIVALGRVAGKTLLKQDIPLNKMREKRYNYYNTELIVTYHPAALLRNAGFKRPTWEDFKLIRSILEEGK